MMKEHNKKTLIEALSTLPEHEPAEELWQRIESQTVPAEEDRMPRSMVRQLPEYEPPAQVWERISAKLDAGGKVRTLGWRYALAAAASLALLLLAYWQLNRKYVVEADAMTVTYSREMVDPLLLVKDWDEDEAAFSEFLNLCQSKKFICEQPEFRQLQSELEELTLAKNELKNALGDYGSDPNLVLQIKEIELERTDLLKKMMVMLI